MTDSPAALAWRRFRRSGAAPLGLAIVGALVAFAALGPALTSWAPNASDFSLRRDAFGAPPGPSAAHWLGTDALFRDLLSRLASGARVSLFVAIGATLLSSFIGTAAGLAAGWCADGRYRFVDTALMRIVDVLIAMPFLLFVAAIGVAVGETDVGTMVLVLGIAGWTSVARLVRSKTLELRSRDFVTASRALGARPLRIVLRHVLPNVAPPVVVLATTLAGQMILAEAVLSYLTVGVQPPRATWGRMLHEAEPYLASRIGLVAAPGIAILLAVLGFSRLGEGLRDAIGGPEAPRRRWPFDLALAGAALLFGAVASPPSVRPPLPAGAPSPSPVRGGTLRVATLVNLRSLDPAIAYDEVTGAIDNLVFARLVTWDRRGEITADLCERWRVSEDGKTYTFELRPRVLFHDGTELDAADIKRSLERALAKTTPSPGASLFSGIRGFAAFHAGKAAELTGVRVVGPRTVAIDLDDVDATFLARLTLGFAAPVCASAGASVDPRSQGTPCGAGPFRVVAFDPDKGVELARHEGYFDPGRPHLDKIVWSTNVRPQTQRYELEDGTIDYARDLTATDAATLRGAEAWRGQSSWSAKLSTSAVFLNTELAPFDRRGVRRAVALALDPEVLERARPDIVAADRILPGPLDAGGARGSLRHHDVAAALREMEAAGYPFDPATGRGGYPGEVEYLAVPDTWDQQVGEVFQQQLAKVGIRLKLRLVAYATFLAETSRRRATQMGTTGWNADFADASNFFEPTLASDAIADEGSQNVAFFANKAFDAALARGRATTDVAARRAAYRDAERIVADEAPWVPTYASRTFEIWQPYVRGYAPHPILPEDFRDVWLAPRGEAHARSPHLDGPFARRP